MLVIQVGDIVFTVYTLKLNILIAEYMQRQTVQTNNKKKFAQIHENHKSGQRNLTKKH